MNIKNLIKLTDDTGLPVRWVALFVPDGYEMIYTSKGNYLVDKEAILAAFRGQNHDLVIDYEHQSLQGSVAPAAGWIKNLEVRGDGALYAEIEWTEMAAGYIKNKEYRYLSPTILTDGAKAVGLHSVALTNTPAMHGAKALTLKDAGCCRTGLISLANDELNNPAVTAEKENKRMKKILELLGLAPTLGEAEAENAAVLAITALKEAKDKAVTALSLSATATAAEIEGKIVALSGNTTQLEKLQAEVTRLNTEMNKKAADELVAVALSEGKLVPAQKPWAEKYALENPEGFKSWFASALPIVALSEGLKPAAKKEGELGSAEAAILKNCGVSVEDYNKYTVGGVK
jgi:phage I-like protein